MCVASSSREGEIGNYQDKIRGKVLREKKIWGKSFSQIYASREFDPGGGIG